MLSNIMKKNWENTEREAEEKSNRKKRFL